MSILVHHNTKYLWWDTNFFANSFLMHSRIRNPHQRNQDGSHIQKSRKAASTAKCLSSNNSIGIATGEGPLIPAGISHGICATPLRFLGAGRRGERGGRMIRPESIYMDRNVPRTPWQHFLLVDFFTWKWQRSLFQNPSHATVQFNAFPFNLTKLNEPLTCRQE